MLFNSHIFIFLFLPLVLIAFWHIKTEQKRYTLLLLSSLIFYGWWNPAYLPLLVLSFSANYYTALRIQNAQKNTRNKKAPLIIGIIFNLGLLGYFKYANFFLDSLNTASDIALGLPNIILPLGISFFTFQQIAYLVDVYRGLKADAHFIRYAVFVSFFPQLIAGPIVHHQELVPQIKEKFKRSFNPRYLETGLFFFLLGLFKKIIIADTLGLYVSPIYARAEAGQTLAFFEAWVAASGYTFQLYFDFSGYSDMAIGLGAMFGVILPTNFNSPYKSKNIIEFWRRWHITLSNFLKDYLYIPLGGSKGGAHLQYRNILITMLLGGLWHGAGWTFVLWGGLHGLFIILNHLTLKIISCFGTRIKTITRTPTFSVIAHFITIVFLVFTWVLFRAETFSSGLHIIQSMVGYNGILVAKGLGSLIPETLSFVDIAAPGEFWLGFKTPWWILPYITACYLICIFMPNTQRLHDMYQQVKTKRVLNIINYSSVTGVALALLAAYLFAKLGGYNEFLYFQF